MSAGFPPGIFVTTIGPLFLANSFSLLFLGAILAITYDYFERFGTNDRWIFKAAVISGFTWSLVEGMCYLGWAYLWTAKNYGNPAAFASLPYFYPAVCLAEGFATFTNHLFYSWRIRVLSGKIWLSIIIMFFSTYQIAYIFWMAPLLFKHPDTAELFKTVPSGRLPSPKILNEDSRLHVAEVYPFRITNITSHSLSSTGPQAGPLSVDGNTKRS